MDETFALNNPAATLPSFDDVHPQKAYAELLRCPVDLTGKKVLAKRADIVAFNRHPAVRANDGVHLPLGATEPLIPLMFDGAEQKLYRRLLDPLFTPKAMAYLEPKIRRLTDDLIDGFIDDGHTDLFPSLCQALPTTIFLELLGLPQAELPIFLRFKDAVIRPEGATREEQLEFSEREGQIVRDLLTREFDEREAAGNPGEDLIAGLLGAEVDGRKLTRSETINIVYLLVIAGLDTVTASLSVMFSWLAGHPEQRAELVADPSRVPSAVEELLRYEAPVMYGSRYVAEDFAINDVTFSAGEWVDVMWASANLDPDAFENPLEVDLRRSRNVHTTFATGPHRCLGSNLARLEMVTAIDQFHRRIPEYWITEGRQPQYFNQGVRVAVHLPISFPPGGVASTS
jgi:cytochrome P450